MSAQVLPTTTAPQPAATLLWAPAAWMQGQWKADALLEVSADGTWASLACDQPCPPQAQCLPGPVLPGMVNAHSHAFQRAFAGLAEFRRSEHDDFWSWREQMYGVALRLSPDDVKRWATRLYRELLAGGYTQVCEFHYLHHDTDGKPYAQPLALCAALAEAALETGIGLTLLPVLYQRAGFSQPHLRAEQRRFATQTDDVLRLRDGIRAWRQPGLSAGLAIHSLRAATAQSVQLLGAAARADGAVLHIHAAEQMAEVDDCVAATGLRPLQWLLENADLSPQWQLVHATQALPDEIAGVARSGAGVVLCPSTEANLGDGFTDVPGWLNSATPLSIGSDSHVCRAWPEELRWLDYGQRLLLRRRNVCADPLLHAGASAPRLFERALAGGCQAAGFERWGLVPGARADLLVLDAQDSCFSELPWGHCLDALVYSSPSRPFARVMAAGRWVIGE